VAIATDPNDEEEDDDDDKDSFKKYNKLKQYFTAF